MNCQITMIVDNNLTEREERFSIRMTTYANSWWLSNDSINYRANERNLRNYCTHWKWSVKDSRRGFSRLTSTRWPRKIETLQLLTFFWWWGEETVSFLHSLSCISRVYFSLFRTNEQNSASRVLYLAPFLHYRQISAFRGFSIKPVRSHGRIPHRGSDQIDWTLVLRWECWSMHAEILLAESYF